jgi:hypothetical protein
MGLSGHGAYGHMNRQMHKGTPRHMCQDMIHTDTQTSPETCACSVTFCHPESQALMCGAWTHGRAVEPVCAVLSLCTMSAVHVQ